MLEGSDEPEGFEGGSRITPSLGCDVVLPLAGLDVGPEVQARGDDDLSARAVVDHCDRAGRSVRTLREPVLKDSTCLFLEPEVDGGEYLESAAALTVAGIGGAAE